eukprot:3297406-Amphidinium_carterae.1
MLSRRRVRAVKAVAPLKKTFVNYQGYSSFSDTCDEVVGVAVVVSQGCRVRCSSGMLVPWYRGTSS